MTQFFLITGFLGSGKTTFLKNILKLWGGQHRIAIIQNEFAPSGVDGKELKSTSPDFQLIEINNGSVFCACLLGNFIETIHKVVTDYQPEMIFLEASGLADPINIAEILQSDKLSDNLVLNQIISLVDAQNFNKGMKTLTRFKHQIMIADTVILNKEDLIAESIEDVKQQVKSLNPAAQIITTSYGEIDLDTIRNFQGKNLFDFHGQESEGAPSIKACVLRSHDKLTVKQLESFLLEMKKNCIRIKGFVNLTNGSVASFHAVFDSIQINELSSYSGPTEIIAFGEGLSVQNLRQTFKTNIL